MIQTHPKSQRLDRENQIGLEANLPVFIPILLPRSEKICPQSLKPSVSKFRCDENGEPCTNLNHVAINLYLLFNLVTNIIHFTFYFSNKNNV
jgi:hypothetical protein